MIHNHKTLSDVRRSLWCSTPDVKRSLQCSVTRCSTSDAKRHLRSSTSDPRSSDTQTFRLTPSDTKEKNSRLSVSHALCNIINIIIHYYQSQHYFNFRENLRRNNLHVPRSPNNRTTILTLATQKLNCMAIFATGKIALW